MKQLMDLKQSDKTKMVPLAVQYSGYRRRYQGVTHSHLEHLLWGLSAVDAHYQVCSILWSPHYKELISGHGLPRIS